LSENKGLKPPSGEIEIIETSDGSSTLYLPDKDETYHSTHGAMQESRHVFIEAGLRPLMEAGKKDIEVLEIGFGTGLNALLTLLEAKKTKVQVNYVSLEPYPLPDNILSHLNYGKLLDANDAFEKIHSAEWNTLQTISQYFTLRKMKGAAQDFSPSKKFDLIYFDAFAPRVQPELWTEELFRKLYGVLHAGGILVTYCSKGDVRRAMISAGFIVEKLPGPPGKRQMLRAKNELPPPA
jgi:tRNA U34 5-methylaminomethyl-2-thiouridine-forming methyltransferase MnmC